MRKIYWDSFSKQACKLPFETPSVHIHCYGLLKAWQDILALLPLVHGFQWNDLDKIAPQRGLVFNEIEMEGSTKYISVQGEKNSAHFKEF